MKANTPRQKAVRRALRELIPHAPVADFEPILEAATSRHMRDLAPADSAFLATVAHIRHRYTDYDTLRDEGYDADSARFFVAATMDEKLRQWGAPRGVESL